MVQFFSIFLPLFTITQSGDIIDKQISGLWYSYENLLWETASELKDNKNIHCKLNLHS